MAANLHYDNVKRMSRNNLVKKDALKESYGENEMKVYKVLLELIEGPQSSNR